MQMNKKQSSGSYVTYIGAPFTAKPPLVGFSLEADPTYELIY